MTQSASERIVVELDSGGNIRCTLKDSSGTTISDFQVASVLVNDRQYHIGISADVSLTGSAQVYVNGLSKTPSYFTDSTGTIDFTTNEASVAANFNASAKLNGDLSELFVINDRVDFASTNPFYDTETNKPKYLGEQGELPTGSQPLIYLPLRADDAGKNLGSGGDFTVNS